MMRIAAVGTSIPEFVATNEYVISLALDVSKKTYTGATDELESDIRSFLEKAGSRERRWRSARSKPVEYILDAWHNCRGQLGPSVLREIGTLIYCGIDRGFAEPAHAAILAQQFELDGVRAFDISDACMGWFTALQVASNSGLSNKPFTVIVSAEFPLEMPGKVYPGAFAIKSREDLMWKGAALTLGEAASVTVVQSTVPVCSVFKSNSKLADVCCVPLIRPDRFISSDRLLPKLGEDCFVAHMPSMTSSTYRDAQYVLATYIKENGIPDVVLPHTISQHGPTHASKTLLRSGVVRNCFEFFGNIATSSIPVGYEYFDCGLSGPIHIAGWISAAGMKHCAFKLS